MTDRNPAYSKTCAKCGEHKPLTCYTFHNGYWDGLEGTCKACRRILKVKFTEIQQEQFRLNNYPANVKRCSDCKFFLPLEEFCKKRKYRDGLSYICRACELAKNSKFMTVEEQEPETEPIIKKKRILFSL